MSILMNEVKRLTYESTHSPRYLTLRRG